jgi:hypothetical protein
MRSKLAALNEIQHVQTNFWPSSKGSSNGQNIVMVANAAKLALSGELEGIHT